MSFREGSANIPHCQFQ